MSDVRSYKCFKQVADVIGEEQAVTELGRVEGVGKEAHLADAFIWIESPQGHVFWMQINCGKSPYTENSQATKSDGSTREQATLLIGHTDSHEMQTFGPLKKDMKFDGGKPQMNLLPADALLAVAEVLTFGAQKYEADSWKQVEGGKERYEAALLRHWAAFKSGENNDAETGLSHWAHIACNALFLVHLHSGETNE